MFKKPLAHRSNATPIRSSARRQLVNAIFAQYPSFLPPSTDPADDGVSEKELGKMIVPEGVKTGSVETSSETEGMMYFDPKGDPLWMTLGRYSKEYIPTLYLLSLDLPRPPLPIIQIHHPVPPPILTGAPLFLPAVRNLHRPHLLPQVPKGGLITFVTSEGNNDQVSYIGVGRVVAEGGVGGAVERRRWNLEQRRDVEEGRFCEMLCLLDDHLWEMGSKPTLKTFTLPPPTNPLVPPPQEAGPSRPRTPIDDLVDDTSNLKVNNAAAPVASLSPSDVSTLLSLALLQALTSNSLPLSSFPIPASSLYSAHVLHNRPAYIPKDQRDEVVIGKSEWKKLAKWMKEVSKGGLLRIKEAKGEIVVQGFDPLHPSLQTHAPFVTIAEADAKAAKKAAEGATTNGDTVPNGGVKGKGKQLDIEEKWKPREPGVAFWQAAGVDPSELHPASALKNAFESYVNKHDLYNPQDRRMVRIDDLLAPAVGIKKVELGTQLVREEILRRFRAGVNWSVVIDGVVKKGALQPITMSVKTRQGRKTVTLIASLETFGIDVEAFAEELKKLCAGSSTVQPLSGASPKLNLKEIMVQGSQIKLVTEALEAKGVPRKWIKEVEGGKKKK